MGKWINVIFRHDRSCIGQTCLINLVFEKIEKSSNDIHRKKCFGTFHWPFSMSSLYVKLYEYSMYSGFRKIYSTKLKKKKKFRLIYMSICALYNMESIWILLVSYQLNMWREFWLDLYVFYNILQNIVLKYFSAQFPQISLAILFFIVFWHILRSYYVPYTL